MQERIGMDCLGLLTEEDLRLLGLTPHHIKKMTHAASSLQLHNRKGFKREAGASEAALPVGGTLPPPAFVESSLSVIFQENWSTRKPKESQAALKFDLHQKALMKLKAHKCIQTRLL